MTFIMDSFVVIRKLYNENAAVHARSDDGVAVQAVKEGVHAQKVKWQTHEKTWNKDLNSVRSRQSI